MQLLERTARIINAALKAYGPSSVKRVLWDREYSGTKWDFADNTLGDCVYAYVERYLNNGSILDLGCGAGNTATELATNAYSTYVGVDISDTCLKKAARRSQQNGRAAKNRFAQGDLLSYIPDQTFDVILFRESLYHVPLGRITEMLNRYAKYLSNHGVFIFRVDTSDSKGGNQKPRPMMMLTAVEAYLETIEKWQDPKSGATVVVSRLRPNVPD